MNKSDCILYLFLAIIVSCIILYLVQHVYQKEGFETSQSRYEALRARLKTAMKDYCDLATYVQEQMKIIYMARKPSEAGATETEAQAQAHIRQTYIDVYTCKDDDASSRQSCSSPSTISDPNFIPCSTYSLPAWTNSTAAAVALSAIPDDLPERVRKELDWYAQIIKKVSDALALGASPPTEVPDSPNSPATNASGKPWSIDGFENPRCTAAQAQAVQAQAQAQAASSSCTMPSVDPEIARVNALLDSTMLKSSLSKSSTIKTAMVKVKSDQQKAADGTLYSWQKAPPKKTYTTYPSGNRTDALLGSIKQNR